MFLPLHSVSKILCGLGGCCQKIPALQNQFIRLLRNMYTKISRNIPKPFQ